jgi:cyanate permease
MLAKVLSLAMDACTNYEKNMMDELTQELLHLLDVYMGTIKCFPAMVVTFLTNIAFTHDMSNSNLSVLRSAQPLHFRVSRAYH